MESYNKIFLEKKVREVFLEVKINDRSEKPGQYQQYSQETKGQSLFRLDVLNMKTEDWRNSSMDWANALYVVGWVGLYLKHHKIRSCPQGQEQSPRNNPGIKPGIAPEHLHVWTPYPNNIEVNISTSDYTKISNHVFLCLFYLKNKTDATVLNPLFQWFTKSNLKTFKLWNTFNEYSSPISDYYLKVLI